MPALEDPRVPLSPRRSAADSGFTWRLPAGPVERGRFPEPAGKECLAREHSAFVPPAGSRVPHTALNFRSLVFKNIFPHPKPNKIPPQVPDKVPATHTMTFLVPGLSPWGPGRERLQAEGAAHGRTPAPRVQNQLPMEPSRRTFFFLKCI